MPFVDADYDVDNWFARAKGMEWEPERGARCTMCFDMRFERTALYAYENEFPVMTSSLGISRWKIWLRSMHVAFVQPSPTRALPIGTTTGARAEEPSA